MSLLPLGITNAIVEYRAKTKEIVATINDANGRYTDLGEYDGYFYAKKYPLNLDEPVDVSIFYSSKDNSTGTITFDFSPIIADIEPGDYVYEIVLANYDKKITVIKDRFILTESLNNRYGDIIFNIYPISNTFTVNNDSLTSYIAASSYINWEIITPNWLLASPSTGTGSVSIDITPLDFSTNIGFDQIELNSVYGSRYIDVSIYRTDLTIYPNEYLFSSKNTSADASLVTLLSNDWEFVNVPSFITIDNESGNGDSSINISIDILDESTQSIIDISSTYDYTKQITVTYLDTSINIIPNEITLSLGTNNEDISLLTYEANTWYVDSQPSWLVIDNSIGVGDTSINISTSLDGNDTGVVTFKSEHADDASVNVIVDNYLNNLWWTFDNTLTDSTATYTWEHGGNGTNPDYQPGIVNESLFVYIDEYYTLDTSAFKSMFDLEQTYTLSFWFKVNYGTPGDFRLINLNSGGLVDNSLIISGFWSSSTLIHYFQNSERISIPEIQNYDFREWRLFTMVVEGYNVKYYMDTDLIHTHNFTVRPPGDLHYYTNDGLVKLNDSRYDYRMKYYDEMRFVDRAITEDDILYLYNQGHQ